MNIIRSNRWHNCTSVWCPISVKVIWFIIAFRKVLWSKTKSTPNDLQMSGEPVYALRVHFKYDLEVSEKKKKIDKLESLKKTLNMWSQRDLSIVGRINIIKLLALSKLFFICSVMSTPKDSSKEVNRITFDVIWNHKPAKIKETTLFRQKKNSWRLGHKGFFSLW